MQKKDITKKLVKRFYTILLAISLLFVFNVSAFAVDNSENLVSHNFNEWQKLPDYTNTTTILGNSNANGIQSIICGITSQSDYRVAIGGIYDISSSYNVGDEYILSFEFLDSTPYVGGAGLIGTERAFTEYYSTLLIGVGSYNNNSVDVAEEYAIIIDENNYSDYINGNVTFSFEMPSGLVNPCVAIAFVCQGDNSDQVNSVMLSFRYFSLINKTTQEKDNFFNELFSWFENQFKRLENIILYLDPEGDKNYTNPFPITDDDVNGADDFNIVVNGLEEFKKSLLRLSKYITVPSTMLSNLGEKFDIIPPLVVVSLCGLSVMRLFGVRRDN